MADPNGFLNYPRNDNPYRELAERIKDFAELQVSPYLLKNDKNKRHVVCIVMFLFAIKGYFMGANGLSQVVQMIIIFQSGMI